MKPQEILPDLWLFGDSCNVYVLKDGDRAVVIDFGTGEWLDQLPELGISTVEHVLLTHHHKDQCAGLLKETSWPFTIHAPLGEDFFLDPAHAGEFGPPPWYQLGCPPSYSPPPERISGIQYDISGNGHFYWHGRRIRFMDTPGHGPNACSVVLDHQGRQILFCGDAAHAGGTIWQPFHLEWDHWTGTGALAAWEGVRRLHGIATGMLCPSHGPVVREGAREMLEALADRLLRFYHAKGQISPGEEDRWLQPEIMACGARKYSEHLYQFGGNGYLLISSMGRTQSGGYERSSGGGLVVDPTMPDMEMLEALLDEIGGVTAEVMLVSHYHYDHCDAIPYLRERYGAEAWLHPQVAEPLRDPARAFAPWVLSPQPILPDHLWPDSGTWQWQEFEFRIAHWPGQTWWHCVFMTIADDRRVLFGGDCFTPSSKWNGTGGFCAYNGCRFEDGFIPSAQLVLDWQPDIIAAGHTNCYEFSPSKFTKIIAWAAEAEEAVRALCPSGDLEVDYYSAREVVRQHATDASSQSRTPQQER